MAEIQNSNIPAGFRFGATTAGIKASGNPDLGMIEAPEYASAAAVFTTNLVVAAPVTIGREYLKASKGEIRAVLVNAGNANCATGKQGFAAAEQSCEELAKALGTQAKSIFPSSTGVIGVPFPIEKLLAGIPSVMDSAGSSAEHAQAFAQAIMTTDTRPKIATAEFTVKGKTVRVLGVAKGAGMIHPNMATMLAYVVTDIEASPSELNKLLKRTADRTFNRISIDGDTSTNDTLCLLASGKSGVALKNVQKAFAGAFESVCSSLAEQIVTDGEGVKHVVRLNIEQAKSEAEAEQIAKTIAHSPLVKTAWAGADPNWGRILAAVGRSGIRLDPSKVNIYFGCIQVCSKGQAASFDEKKAHAYLSQPAFEITVKLGRGRESITFLTCDLTTEYVHINADYTT
ncbi:MAG TPA: bifunctional glutamate N-acetyltransferase/amino-acid acetyltransferase ArgJ [Terriglobales bacterium]|nr:bifunctional glutamate N-acetyltransferase/amino-acid acetyltransferase ArgJ [Terriglobales bacterium]